MSEGARGCVWLTHAVESLVPWGWTDRQTQEAGLRWAFTSSPPHPAILTVDFYLFVSLFAELPPGWEKIDDPVYGVYYVE